MKMIFSITKPEKVQLIQKQNQNKNITQTPKIYINPFNNIFSRLQTSGSCSSCG